MNGQVKLPNCRVRPLISVKCYEILQGNTAFTGMNMDKYLSGGNMRNFMLNWMNEQCLNSKHVFVVHLIALHSEVDYYGQSNTRNVGYGCVHRECHYKAKSTRFQPY